MKKLSQKERMKVTLDMFGDMHKKLKESNPTAKEVRAANIKVVVASPEWQKIRHDFIGTWNDTPGSDEIMANFLISSEPGMTLQRKM